MVNETNKPVLLSEILKNGFGTQSRLAVSRAVLFFEQRGDTCAEPTEPRDAVPANRTTNRELVEGVSPNEATPLEVEKAGRT